MPSKAHILNSVLYLESRVVKSELVRLHIFLCNQEVTISGLSMNNIACVEIQLKYSNFIVFV